MIHQPTHRYLDQIYHLTCGTTSRFYNGKRDYAYNVSRKSDGLNYLYWTPHQGYMRDELR